MFGIAGAPSFGQGDQRGTVIAAFQVAKFGGMQSEEIAAIDLDVVI